MEQDIQASNAFDFTFLANWEKFQRWQDEMTNENFLPTDELGYGGIGSEQLRMYPVMIFTVQEMRLWDVCIMCMTNVT